MSTASMPAPETASIPQGERETVKCFYCKLSQFRAESSKCRRCKRCVDDPALMEVVTVQIAATAPAPVLWPETDYDLLAMVVAELFTELRGKARLSQRQLAARMGVPRSYISKIENSKVMPVLSSLYRICDALGVTVTEFTTRVDQRRIMITLHRIATEAGENNLPSIARSGSYRAPHIRGKNLRNRKLEV